MSEENSPEECKRESGGTDKKKKGYKHHPQKGKTSRQKSRSIKTRKHPVEEMLERGGHGGPKGKYIDLEIVSSMGYRVYGKNLWQRRGALGQIRELL